MRKLKYGDVVRVTCDKEVFNQYDKDTLCAVVDFYNSGDKMRYRIADSTCKSPMDGWWYDEDEIEFTGRNVAYVKEARKYDKRSSRENSKRDYRQNRM